MEVENQVSFISPVLQNTQFGNVDDETTITFKEDADTPMTIDASAPGDVIELSDDFDFDGYQVVRREFFAHTFEPSITFNNYKVYVNTACLNKFPHADCAQLLINRESRILALRPCAESERDAFAWCNTSGGKRKPRQVTGKFFFAKLFELMDWNIDYRYKLLGKVIHANVLAGVARMVVAFGDQLRDETFKERVGFMSVRQLSRIAKERGAGSLCYAEAMLVAYNRKCKYTLRMTKLHSGKVAVEDDFVEENEEPLADDPVLEE